MNLTFRQLAHAFGILKTLQEAPPEEPEEFRMFGKRFPPGSPEHAEILAIRDKRLSAEESKVDIARQFHEESMGHPSGSWYFLGIDDVIEPDDLIHPLHIDKTMWLQAKSILRPYTRQSVREYYLATSYKKPIEVMRQIK